MASRKRFDIGTLDQLRAELASLGLRIPLSEDLSILGAPVRIGAKTAPNRFAVHPMEGFDADEDGEPGPLSFRRYRRYAEGGAGLIWFEATAVLEEARSNPHQFWLHEGSAPVYARLVESTRRAAAPLGREPILILQLTHSGRYSKPRGLPKPLIAHHSCVLDPTHALPPDYPLLTDEYLDRLLDTYVAAAKLAANAGFDGVDVKACHRYLVSELLASFVREGRYGGSFENRTRFLLTALRRIRDEAKGLFVATRLNVFDAIRRPYGFGVDETDETKPDLREPIELVGRLKALGVPILNISVGNPYFNPHYGRPYDWPIQHAPEVAEHPLAGVVRFLNITRRIQEAHPDLPVVGSGYSWLRHLVPNVAAGVLATGGATLIGLGRSAFAYPTAPRDILRDGRMDPAKCCVACSGCTQIMRDGGRTGCVVRDGAIYAEEYRKGRRRALDYLREEAQRCRQCFTPSCRTACPAGVDVPAFLRAFAEDRLAESYDILRADNVLPEMCAFVCPSEVQCEGGCLERIFCGRAVPIRDIQLAVCQAARRNGHAGVRMPSRESGRRIAVVGAGPAGLACAIRLLERGHRVDLFDRLDRLGGTPDAVIPTERFESAKAEAEAILEPALRAGRLSVRLGEALGAGWSLPDLESGRDAVFLAVGLGRSESLGRAPGVLDALDFLRKAKQRGIEGVPPRVAVLGAGNTAMDAAITAVGLGARDVFLVYRRSFVEMPAWPAERDRALAAGIHFLILTQPLGYATDEAGRLSGVRIARTALGDPDESGRRRPAVLPETESVLSAGLAIEALGQSVPEEIRKALAPLPFTRRGLLQVQSGGWTGVRNIFAGGDIVNGGTTAVLAIAEGLRAAGEIHARLAGIPCAAPAGPDPVRA